MSLDQEGTVAVLKRVLTGSARLPGAACIGQTALFDPPGERETSPSVVRRHEAAARVCQFVCPVRDECSAWVDTLTPRQRPAGVIAARRPHLPASPGRPKREIA